MMLRKFRSKNYTQVQQNGWRNHVKHFVDTDIFISYQGSVKGWKYVRFQVSGFSSGKVKHNSIISWHAVHAVHLVHIVHCKSYIVNHKSYYSYSLAQLSFFIFHSSFPCASHAIPGHLHGHHMGITRACGWGEGWFITDISVV